MLCTVQWDMYYLVSFNNTDLSISYSGVCFNDSLHFTSYVELLIFLHQIARTFGPAFLLELYVAGALTGSAFFLLEMTFLAQRKQVRIHSVYINQAIQFQIVHLQSILN